jgi:VanZ family protein
MTAPSLTPGAATGRTAVMLARFVAWAMSAAILVLTFVPPQLRPVSDAPHALEHFVPFLLLGGAYALGYPRRELGIAVAAVPFIGILEWLQLFAPGRHARMSDFIVNAAAACTGIVLVALAARIRARKSAHPLG